MSLKSFLYNHSPQCLKDYRKKLLTSPYPIVKNPNEVFNKVYKVKEETWEDSYYPECYGLCKEQHLVIKDKKRYIYSADNSIAVASSDAIITSHGVYWDKFNDEEFCTWASPADANIYWFNHQSVGLRRFKKKECIPGKTFSMVGVWSFHWAHCMYQFMPKLFSAGEAGLLNQDITILIDASEDGTIMEIIKEYLKCFPNAKLKKAYPKIEYLCETLYFMDSCGSNFNNCKFRLDYPYFIPRHALDKIQKYVIDPLIEKVKDNKPTYDKIFLPRGHFRTLTNYEEVHNYFKEQGFVDLEGSNLTLEQKADYFYHAKEIVGLYGSAFLNLMFCNKAKSMVLINYKMSTDTSLYLQIRDHVADLVNVTGQDDSEWYHSNYYIPLEKIKKVYNERIATK